MPSSVRTPEHFFNKMEVYLEVFLRRNGSVSRMYVTTARQAEPCSDV